MELFPHSLSLSHSLLSPASLPCHLSRILPHLFFSLTSPQHLLHPLFKAWARIFTHFAVPLSLQTSSSPLQLLLFCLPVVFFAEEINLKIPRGFLVTVILAPTDTAHRTLERFGICGGRQENQREKQKVYDWQLWPMNHSEFHLNMTSFWDTSAGFIATLVHTGCTSKNYIEDKVRIDFFSLSLLIQPTLNSERGLENFQKDNFFHHSMFIYSSNCPKWHFFLSELIRDTQLNSPRISHAPQVNLVWPHATASCAPAVGTYGVQGPEWHRAHHPWGEMLGRVWLHSVVRAGW